MLGAEPVAEQAERDAAAHARQPFDAVDRDRRDQRDAAGDGIAHGMEDRTGMRGAAEEIRQQQDDELRRPDRLPHGHVGLRPASAEARHPRLRAPAARRTSNAAGIMTAATISAMISSEVRQS